MIPSCAEAFNLETIFPKLDAFALTEYLDLTQANHALRALVGRGSLA